MRQAIATLEKVGHTHQIHDGRWLFKAVLAPKPHQEHVHHTDNFVWHFCINYVPLNAVTQIIAFPIPCCDLAVSKEFVTGLWMWLYDAPSGYHQLSVALASQEKLAFQGLGTIKWTYTVIPFGPTNGLATFVNCIYDVDSQWKSLACSSGITIDDKTNTRIIIDDIVSHGQDLETSLLYMECQLHVCLSYGLSLSLKKSHIFPRCFEFIGNNVCPNRNRPAQSKHQFHQTWPKPEIICNVAKFIGFIQFYRKYIHHFELQISSLQTLTIKQEYTEPVNGIWNDGCQCFFDDIRQAIISDPCLLHFNHWRLVILRINFFISGVWLRCLPAPGTDKASEVAMVTYCSGSDFAFMLKDSSAVIPPVAFGRRRCCGNEIRLHFHLGKGFAGNWAINKNYHMLFGQRFMWVTDCYAICFILPYDGNNPAIACLQMRLMCWDVGIVHRHDSHLVDTDYWSLLGADICFDPLFKSYLDFDWGLCKEFPTPISLPMKPENMPYYQGPQITTSMDSQRANSPIETCQFVLDIAHTSHCQSLFLEMVNHNWHGLCHLAHVPVRFGEFEQVTPLDAHKPSNHEIPAYAIRVLRFNWAVYSFGGGHFASTISSRNYATTTSMAAPCSANSYYAPFFFRSGNKMLHHIRSLGDTSQVHGYLIHSLRSWDSKTTSTFWQFQSSIIAQLWTLQNLQMIVALIIPDHNGRCVKTFRRQLKSTGWCISQFDDVFFPNL